MTATLPEISAPLPSIYPLQPALHRLLQGEAMLPDTQNNLIEVVGILSSYGVVLDAYSRNLIFLADRQCLVLFPFFKYFDGEISLSKLARHWWHDRINFEYAEYCSRGMLWHGGGGLDAYLDSAEFEARCQAVVKQMRDPLLGTVHKLFPSFVAEQLRQCAYHSFLGQFWRVMSDMFVSLAERYDAGEIQSIPEVVQHVQDAAVAAAALPFTYAPLIKGERIPVVADSAGLTFLADAALPYVEAVFFRAMPFMGNISYNAQAGQISPDPADFQYGALYADALPIGSAGIPPTLLMQDMRHYLPDYLTVLYEQNPRGMDDLRVQICQSFQKSMYCVTTAVMRALAPHPLDSTDPDHQAANVRHFSEWLHRLAGSPLAELQ